MQRNDHTTKDSVLLAPMNDTTTKTPNLLPPVAAPVLAPPALTARVTYQHLENDLVTCVYRKIRGYEELKKKTAGEKCFAEWAVAKSLVGEPIVYRCFYKDIGRQNVQETFGDEEEMEAVIEAVQAGNWGKRPTSLKLIVQMS